MNNFHKIEQLIDTEVYKQKIPAEIGQSPEWKVGYRKNNKKKSWGKNRKKSGRKS